VLSPIWPGCHKPANPGRQLTSTTARKERPISYRWAVSEGGRSGIGTLQPVAGDAGVWAKMPPKPSLIRAPRFQPGRVNNGRSARRAAALLVNRPFHALTGIS